jgi:hypothetical protein
MLKASADFPHAGSFALYVDHALPPSQQRAELVRLMRAEDERGHAMVAFPLRDGASGSKRVLAAHLIDGTPLTSQESREHTDLENHLRGRDRLTPRLREMLVRAEKLRSRAIFSMVMESELAKLRALEARADASSGRPVPREFAA